MFGAIVSTNLYVTHVFVLLLRHHLNLVDLVLFGRLLVDFKTANLELSRCSNYLAPIHVRFTHVPQSFSFFLYKKTKKNYR